MFCAQSKISFAFFCMSMFQRPPICLLLLLLAFCCFFFSIHSFFLCMILHWWQGSLMLKLLSKAALAIPIILLTSPSHAVFCHNVALIYNAVGLASLQYNIFTFGAVFFLFTSIVFVLIVFNSIPHGLPVSFHQYY